MAINEPQVSRNVDAADEFTTHIQVRGSKDQPAYILAASDNNNSFSGTITVQGRVPGGTDWNTITTYTTFGFFENITLNSNCDVRIGCKAAEYTSGDIDVFLIYGS